MRIAIRPAMQSLDSREARAWSKEASEKLCAIALYACPMFMLCARLLAHFSA